MKQMYILIFLILIDCIVTITFDLSWSTYEAVVAFFMFVFLFVSITFSGQLVIKIGVIFVFFIMLWQTFLLRVG